MNYLLCAVWRRERKTKRFINEQVSVDLKGPKMGPWGQFPTQHRLKICLWHVSHSFSHRPNEETHIREHDKYAILTRQYMLLARKKQLIHLFAFFHEVGGHTYC